MELSKENYSSFMDTLPDSFPKDDDGFVKSFEASDRLGVEQFFDTYGFVVIKNVLNDAEIEATLDEFWSGDPKLKKDDPLTWEAYWQRQMFGHLGIIGAFSDVVSLTQLQNRQNPKVYEAFKVVLKNDKLWVDHDRLGVMRPTKGILFPGSSIPVEKPEWRTKQNWLHLDCNPLLGYASIGSFNDSRSTIDFTKTVIIQALITLTDAREENGGFHCVPGAHKHVIDYLGKRPPDVHLSQSNCQFPKKNPLHAKIQKIPVRKGCLLAWTSLLPHGNHPNMSNQWRAVQYIRMMPNSGTPYFPLGCGYFPKEFSVNELGEKLFGIKPW